MHTHLDATYTRALVSALAKGLLLGGIALTICPAVAIADDGSSQTFFQLGKPIHPQTIETCQGAVHRVFDATDEALSFTPVQYGTGAGGGQGGQFDPTPILTIPKVTLLKGECINAHLSVLVGSGALYGTSTESLFQVALVPAAGGAPVALEGHYATPYGIPSPAVADAAAPDVNMFAANFYQGLDGDVPPGVYNVNVYWAGAPNPGGVIGAAAVLKLYVY